MRALCFCCGRRLGRNPALVTCRDEQDVFVGSECFGAIRAAGAEGYQPPTGGPRLFTLAHDPKGAPSLLGTGRRLDAAWRKARTVAPTIDGA